MNLKFLQLNGEQGHYLDTVINFINSGQFDIINLQEVTGIGVSYTGLTSQVDVFETLLKHTNYLGVLCPTLRISGKNSAYYGLATLFKKDIKLIGKEVVELKPYKEVPDFSNPTELPRSALSLTLEVSGKQLYVINTHLAWGITPYDKPYKTQQANKLDDYLKTVPTPFIFSGDFNVVPQTEIVKKLDTLGKNLTKEYNVTNTLNPHTHRAKELFPKGLAVDYIYVSKEVTVNDFHVIDKPDLSDHYGLYLECSI